MHAVQTNVSVIISMQVSSTMKDKTLEVIDQSLIEAGEFLGLIEEDQRRLNCLRDFANSLDVVEWIRTETKGNFLICMHHQNLFTLL